MDFTKLSNADLLEAECQIKKIITKRASETFHRSDVQLKLNQLRLMDQDGLFEDPDSALISILDHNASKMRLKHWRNIVQEHKDTFGEE
ncbi:MAG: hypothetical protein KAR06_00440 [Deltaproteobacteria bacterium]|nr:hypothetical protein [Deltaproteobacteria bacterium]